MAVAQKSEPDWHKQVGSLRSPETSRGTAQELRSQSALTPFQPAESTEPGDVATYGQSVNIMGAFVGGNRLKVHEMSDHRITIGDAHGAE